MSSEYDDFLTCIEENFVFCTKCGDHKYINSLKPHPCSQCNLEEYLDWKKWEDKKPSKKKR